MNRQCCTRRGSTQPSTISGTVKRVLRMSGQWQSTGRLKGQVRCLAYELAATWCQPTFIQVT